MSLRRLMRHYMTIQKADKAVQTEEGFIDYQGSWQNVAENVRCNVQESNLRKVHKTMYSKEEDLSSHSIFFIRTDVYNLIQGLTSLRVIVTRDNFSDEIDSSLLLNNGNKELFNIYEVRGVNNQTEGQRGTRKRVYNIRCEKTTKMDLA